jgi:hypothetical protein
MKLLLPLSLALLLTACATPEDRAAAHQRQLEKEARENFIALESARAQEPRARCANRPRRTARANLAPPPILPQTSAAQGRRHGLFVECPSPTRNEIGPLPCLRKAVRPRTRQEPRGLEPGRTRVGPPALPRPASPDLPMKMSHRCARMKHGSRESFPFLLRESPCPSVAPSNFGKPTKPAPIAVG